MKSIRKKICENKDYFFIFFFLCYNVYVIVMKKSSKKRKRKISIFKIVGLLLFIISIILCIMVKSLDILPEKYFIAILIFLFVVNVVLDYFLFRKKVKKKKKIIALCISILFIILSFFPLFYIGRTANFMESIVAADYKLENYSVVVLKSSEYKDVDDIKELSVGIYENTDGINKAKKELLNKVDVTFENYDDLDNIKKDLMDGKVNVLLLEDSILSMMKEDSPEFEEAIKVIYTFKIKIKSSNEAKDVDVVLDSFNIYITGIDTYGDISSVSRSDVNIVMTVNPKTKQVLLTSIPRDYYVELHGKKGSRDKLTHAGIYGTDMSIGTIEDLLGIEINYYFKVNFTSFVDIINALGGIEAYSKYSFTSIDGYKYSEGYNKMNGEEALSFARERKAFSEGDRQRGADQQAVIEAVIKKMSNKSIISKYNSLLNSIEGKFQTNMSPEKIKSLVKMQLDDMASWNVTSISLDGSNGMGITYSGGNQQLYVMIPNWDTVDEASSTIKAVLDGKKLDESFKPDKTTSTRVMKNYSGSDNYVKKTEDKEDNKKEDDKKEEEIEQNSIDNDIIEDDSSDEKVIEINVSKDSDNNNEKSLDNKGDKKSDDPKDDLDNNNDNKIDDDVENKEIVNNNDDNSQTDNDTNEA